MKSRQRTKAQLFRERQARYWAGREHSTRRDPRDPVISTYAEPKIREILSRVFFSESPRILDVGAGNGYFSYYWSQVAQTTATDYSLVMLANHPLSRKAAMDARHLAFANDSVDLSFCHALLHHVARGDRERVLHEMARVSKKYVVIIEPNRLNPLIAGFSLLKPEEHGGLQFSLSYSRRLIERAGLRVLHACSWGLLTPNRMPLARRLSSTFARFERPLALGVTNIVIAQKQA